MFSTTHDNAKRAALVCILALILGESARADDERARPIIR